MTRFIPSMLGQVFSYVQTGDPMAYALAVLYSNLIGLSFGLLVTISLMFWNRKTRNRPTWVFFIAAILSLIILMYLGVSTLRILWEGEVVYIVEAVHILCEAWPNHDSAACHDALVGLPESGPDETVAATSFYVTQVFLIWMSDTAIAYRAGVLSPRIFMRFIIGALWAICLVLGLLSLLSGSRDFIEVPYCPPKNLNPQLLCTWKFEDQVSYVFVCVSILCNLVSTGVFGWTLWKHRIAIRSAQVPGERMNSLSLRILAVVLESGVAYCTFQLSYLIYHSIVQYVPADTLGLWQTVYMGFSGIYPALIFLVANAQALLHDESLEEYLSTVVRLDRR